MAVDTTTGMGVPSVESVPGCGCPVPTVLAPVPATTAQVQVVRERVIERGFDLSAWLAQNPHIPWLALALVLILASTRRERK